MAILQIQTAPPIGLAAVTSSVQSTQQTLPSIIYILTNDTYATVTATGYLTRSKQEGFTYSNNQMALVYTTDEGPVWLKVVITYSGASVLNTVVSLVQISSPGDVTLPTIASNIIVSTDTVGTLANTTGTAINRGSIQAGLSGDAGTLISYPGTALKGSLIIAGVDNTGNTNVTISNALHGQASVYSIPDVGASTGQFLVKTSALVDGQLIKASGTAGKVIGAGFAVLANTTAAYAGGGTSNAFTATGIGATSIVTASILASTNTVSIAKVVPTANTLTVFFSADPGAATTISWHAITPAV